jgi:hypothetical protein
MLKNEEAKPIVSRSISKQSCERHRRTDKPQNRNTAACQHSRAAERIDPVNPAAAMNTRKCSLMQYGREGDVYARRCGWRGRGNAEPRVGKERKIVEWSARGGKRII